MATMFSKDEMRRLKRRVLLEKCDYLVTELGDAVRYLPFLRSKGVVDQSDCERIRAQETCQAKVMMLVDVLESNTYSARARDRDAFDVFVEALREKKVQVHIARELNRSFVKAKKALASSKEQLEEKHLEAFRAVMAEKGSMEQTIMHCLLFGYPGVGKSSLLKRLRGHPPNPSLPSTGVAEKTVKVEIRRLTTSTAMALRTISQHGATSKWCTLSYDEEAIALMAIAARGITAETSQPTVHHHPNSVTSTPSIDRASTQSLSSEALENMLLRTVYSTEEVRMSASDVELEAPTTCVSKEVSMDALQTASPDEFMEVSESSTMSFRNPSKLEVIGDQYTLKPPASIAEPSTHSHIPPLEVLKLALDRMGLKGVNRYLKRTLTLYITDTGGQLEFQELLPALTAGPTLFFLVFRLDQDLDETVSIEFRYPDGHSTQPYQSSFTVRETLLQSLASIASMGSYVYNKKQGEPFVLKPKVIFIGTHRDKVSSIDKIRQIDRHLQEIVKATSLYHEGLIERVSESQLMVAVNNLSTDDTHFQCVRSLVERIADRDNFRVSLPSTWLIFSLIIRQLKRRVITYSECFTIANQCGIDSLDELDAALWFLNTKVGLVRHFRGEGLEDLQDIVIVDPQILFTTITQLIVNTFTDDHVAANVCDEFKSKGIFPLSALERMSREGEDYQLLTVDRFVKLLEHLHIISRLHTKEVMYFMPCTLAHAQSTAPDLTHSFSAHSIDKQQIPPLLFTFRSGYCPKGLFSALVVYLLANKMKSILDWELQTERIFRNAISLLVGPYDTITLVLTSKYLKVAMLPAEGEGKRMISVEAVCTQVRLCFQTAIREVTSTLHYTSDAEHTLAFYCTAPHKTGHERHPAEVVFYMDFPCSVRCEVGDRKRKHWLPDRYQHWYSKDGCSPSSTITKVDQSEAMTGLSQSQMLSGQCGSPITDEQSHELTVFLKKHSIIHKGISNNVQDIACRMFAQHLIPERVYGSVTGALDRLTACERTDLLLSELESRISVQPAALMQFLDVLKESDACYIPLVRTITETLDAARAAMSPPPPPAEQQH